MPTPARRAMSSSGASAPFSANADGRGLEQLGAAAPRVGPHPRLVARFAAGLLGHVHRSRTLSGLQNGGFLRIVTGVNLRIFPHRTSRLADRGADARDARDRRPGARPGVALAIMLGAQLMIILDATVVNIALPHIQTGLHFSATSLSWVMNGYTLTFGGLLLLGGRAGDILGRRRMFLAGIAIFTLASLAGGLAPNAGRAARGPRRPGRRRRARLARRARARRQRLPRGQGADQGARRSTRRVVTGGSSLGLVLGGLITQWVSWRWVLFVNVPIGIAVAVAHPAVRDRDARGSPAGSTCRARSPRRPASAALVYAFIRAASDGWGDHVAIAAFARRRRAARGLRAQRDARAAADHAAAAVRRRRPVRLVRRRGCCSWRACSACSSSSPSSCRTCSASARCRPASRSCR